MGNRSSFGEEGSPPMDHGNPWIDAVLDGFPEDDPKNDRRRQLLIDASRALPPDWTNPEHRLPDPPSSLARRRRLGWLGIACLAGSLLLIWLLVFSPEARHRLRGTCLSDAPFRSMSETSFSGFLNKVYPTTYDDKWSLWIESDIARRFPGGQWSLCLGTLYAEDLEARWADLRASAPDDAALVAERLRTTGILSEPGYMDTLEAAERIDPDNGYYLLLAAVNQADRAVERDHAKSRSSSGVRSRMPQFRVKDSNAYDKAWKLLDEAIKEPRFDSHVASIVGQRLDHLHPPSDYPDLAKDLIWLYSIQPSLRAFPSGHHLGTLFAVRAEQIESSGSPEEMIHLSALWCRTLETFNRPDLERWGWLSSQSFAGSSSDAMAAAAASMKLSKLESFFADYKATRVAQSVLLKSESPGDHYSTLNQAFDLDPSSDPAPGRLAEHRMFEGLYLIHAAVLLLGIAGILATLRLMASSRLAGLPRRIAALAKLSDHGVITLVGALLPIAIMTAFMEVPFLHPRETTFSDIHALATLLKFAALVVATLLLCLRQSARCLSRRGWPIGFAPIASRSLLGMALLALACAPAATLLMRDHSLPDDATEWMWIGCFSLLGLEVVLLIAGVSVLLYSGHRRIQTSAILQLAMPSLVISAWLIALIVAIDRNIEEHHVSSATAERVDNPKLLKVLSGRSEIANELRQLTADYLAKTPPAVRRPTP